MNNIQLNTKTKKRGVSSIEYGLIAALIAIVAIIAIKQLSKNTYTMYCGLSYYLIDNAEKSQYSKCDSQTGYGQGAAYNNLMSQGKACMGNDTPPGCVVVDDQFLYLMNQKMGVTSVYGLKDSNGNIVTNYNSAMNAIQSLSSGENHVGGVNNPAKNTTYQYEFSTNNGDSFGTFWGGSGTYGAVNLNTGETYILNDNGQIQNVGITNAYGQGN